MSEQAAPDGGIDASTPDERTRVRILQLQQLHAILDQAARAFCAGVSVGTFRAPGRTFR